MDISLSITPAPLSCLDVFRVGEMNQMEGNLSSPPNGQAPSKPTECYAILGTAHPTALQMAKSPKVSTIGVQIASDVVTRVRSLHIHP